jgi:hypothetical protein
MKARFEHIEMWAHRFLAWPAAWLVHGMCLGAGCLAVWAAQCWSWLRRRRRPQ